MKFINYILKHSPGTDEPQNLLLEYSIVIEILTNRKQTILRFLVVFVDFPALDREQPPTGRMIYVFARRMGFAALTHLFNDFRPV